MVKVITTNLNQVVNRLDGKLIRLRRNCELIAPDFLKEVKRKMRLHLTLKGHNWRKKLWNSIDVRKKNRSEYWLFMVKYGVYLDRMKPHWVKLKRGRLIRRWAEDKGNDGVRLAAASQRSIFVRPHPFIDECLGSSLSRLPQIIKNRINRGGKNV